MNAPSAPPKSRWLALHLPRLPTDRLSLLSAAPADRPFALYAKSKNAFVLTAVDACAEAAGLAEDMALADARAIRPDLAAFEAETDKDAAFLDAIAASCERFTPVAVLDPPRGLFLDVTGCTHLFGGEKAMLALLLERLRKKGLAAKAAIAPTPGAAWACARFSTRNLIDELHLAIALAPLPAAALRLEPEAAALMRRLGLATIGRIVKAPRASFAARAGENAMRRLDQAYGRVYEALTPRRPPPPIFVFRTLVEPIVTLEAIEEAAAHLCRDLAARLERRGAGARLLRLSLFGLDGKTREVMLGLTHPARDCTLLLRLFHERLAVAAENFDAAFGFDALRLDAVEIESLVPKLSGLAPPEPRRDPAAEAKLQDVLKARLGAQAVTALSFREDHAPERVSAASPPNGEVPGPPEDGVLRRPLFLYSPAQPIEAMAQVPDGPPLRFRWRRVLREVARAEGPERIAPNWLRAPHAKARDYYRVEDREGRRYWLYREGAYADADLPQWYLHGLFP